MPQSPLNDEDLVQQLRTPPDLERRGLFKGLALLGTFTAAALAGCATEPTQAMVPTSSAAIPPPAPRLRAAFAHNGLNTVWNQRGRDTARMIGSLLGIDIVSYDGELNIDKQRRDLEDIARQDWDFVVVHPLAANAYDDQIRQIVAHGTPVIDIDTRLSDDLEQLGVLTFLEPDNVAMGAQVTSAIIDAVGSDRFDIIHTQGMLTHSGAQGRARGFRQVVAQYPGIRVVDETPGDWNPDRVTRLWEHLLVRYPNVRGAFFHNDEMALAALRAINTSGRAGTIVIGGVDGMQEACDAVASGAMAATVMNPTGRVHGSAVWIGYLRATRGSSLTVPPYIRMDGGLVDTRTATGYRWLGDQLLI